jgi:geranylgeranyl pyrophosphate synthase
VLSAFAAAAPQDLDALRRYFTRETDDITSLLEILERSGAHEASQQALDSYLERALGDLTEAALPSPFESELAALARQVTGQRAPAT